MSKKQELTGAQLLEAAKGLRECGEVGFPPRASIAVGKTLLSLEKIAEVLEGQLQKIQETYIEKDEQGKPVPADNQPGFFKVTDPKGFSKDTAEVFETIHSVEIFEIEDKDVDRLPDLELKHTRMLLKLGVLAG